MFARKKTWAAKGRVVTALAMIAVGATSVLPVTAASAATVPSPATFFTSQLHVRPGTSVNEHWTSVPNALYLLSDASATGIPNFSSTAVSAGSTATWAAQGFWVTSSTMATIKVPDAPNGTTYALKVRTCPVAGFSPVDLSSCTSVSSQGTSTRLTVDTSWTTAPLSSSFSSAHLALLPPTAQGEMMSPAYAPDGTIYASMEFSPGIARLNPGAISLTQATVVNSSPKPFATCMFNNRCVATGATGLGEKALKINNDIWFTQGGTPYFDAACAHSVNPAKCGKNQSVVVDFSPATQQYCTYILPEATPEVIGLTYTGSESHPSIWVTESRIQHGQVDGFTPASSTCMQNATVVLKKTPVGKSGIKFVAQYPAGNSVQVRQIPLALSIAPSEMSNDPSNPNVLWVSNGWGHSFIKVTINTGQVNYYSYTSHNDYAFFGSFPWDIVADQNYVYAANYSDETIVRLTKSTGAVDVVDFPATSDNQGAYGLLLSGSRLYFTASGDQVAGGELGYIDLAQWEGASNACAPGVDCAPQPANKVLFSDLARFTTTSNAFGLSGIAQSSSGQIAVVDYPLGILTLNP